MKNEKDLVPVVIDFTKARDEDGTLNESWWLTFGAILRWVMPSLFKGGTLPLNLTGSPADIKNFANTLGREKNYLQSWRDHGLDSPQTYANKSKLDGAIAQFERTTGLRWPFDR
jgi:hypothetical protein